MARAARTRAHGNPAYPSLRPRLRPALKLAPQAGTWHFWMGPSNGCLSFACANERPAAWAMKFVWHSGRLVRSGPTILELNRAVGAWVLWCVFDWGGRPRLV